MMPRPLWLAIAVLLVQHLGVAAQTDTERRAARVVPPRRGQSQPEAVTRTDTEPAGAADVKALAERIDRRIASRWSAQNVKPAAAADDAVYLRRVYLDLVGQVPTLPEVRDFLDDPSLDKRERLAERLLTTDASARHFATVWRKTLLPDAPFVAGPGSPVDTWLQRQFRDNVPYDRLAREILTAAPNDAALNVFFTANENKAENLAAATSRIFLGVRLECAQCHDHPFAAWKRRQFWEFAAFFSDFQGQGLPAAPRRGELRIPNTDQVVQARLLVGDTQALPAGADPRTVLADWITRADNPYFARATVNRLWAHFFGTGLADPVESLGEDTPPSHPELLEDLGREFAAHKFDVRFLIRALVASKTYGLDSVSTDPAQDDPHLFARALVRGLSAEQLYDTLAVVTGKGAALNNPPGQVPQLNGFGARADFVARFSTREAPADAQTSILQALHLMNGKPMADATSLDGNRLLRTVLEAERRTTAQRVQELYLMVLARKPRPEESARFVGHVDAAGARGDQRKALADVLWVLLNSPEFSLNH